MVDDIQEALEGLEAYLRKAGAPTLTQSHLQTVREWLEDEHCHYDSNPPFVQLCEECFNSAVELVSTEAALRSEVGEIRLVLETQDRRIQEYHSALEEAIMIAESQGEPDEQDIEHLSQLKALSGKGEACCVCPLCDKTHPYGGVPGTDGIGKQVKPNCKPKGEGSGAPTHVTDQKTP